MAEKFSHGETNGSELNIKKTAWIAVVSLIAVIVLFDVSVNFEFSMPRDGAQADPEREAQYQACFEEKDAEIHRIAFATIDNPDVQKEFINTNRAGARGDCRQAYPMQMKMIKEPFRFNDLRAKSASDDTLEAASERLGHTNLRTTQDFYRRKPSRVRPLKRGKL